LTRHHRELGVAARREHRPMSDFAAVTRMISNALAAIATGSLLAVTASK